MKTYLLIGSGIVIVIAVIAYIFFIPSGSTPSQTATSTPGLPVAGSTGVSGTSGTQTIFAPGTPIMTVAATGGASTTVDDFINNGSTSPDVQNPGTYYLAGSAGYCTKGGVCPAGAPAKDFIITYNADKQFFTIALTEEPIGEARLDAQQFLMQTLGITQGEMCGLQYYLGTDVYTNATYAGKNLGFSFCPGATKLPN